jgi:hypothetical protein
MVALSANRGCDIGGFLSITSGLSYRDLLHDGLETALCFGS